MSPPVPNIAGPGNQFIPPNLQNNPGGVT
jgi:hypothetical protein